MLVHQSQKDTQAGDQMHMDTWASGHAADQNWTPSQSQKVKFEMEGIRACADREGQKTDTAGLWPFLLLGTPAPGFMTPWPGGCYPPHVSTPWKDEVWHDG